MNQFEQRKSLTDAVWHWIDKVIIGEQFCPFAKRPREQQKIRLYVSHVSAHNEALEAIAREFERLQANTNVSTTLLAFDSGFNDFEDYLDLIDLAQTMLENLRYEGVYQLASFHPNYLFEGESPNSASHYTNRAPCPIVHILRENEVTQALTTMHSPESIPQRNIKHAESLGVDFFKLYL